MALSAARAADSALENFFDNGIKPALVDAGVPMDKINQMRSNVSSLISAVCSAIVQEITDNAETGVSDAVNTILSEIESGITVPQDGGASLKATIVAALPPTVSSKIS
jgi:hypothetical protein